MSYIKVDGLKDFVNGLDGYIQRSAALDLTVTSRYLTELKTEGEGFVDIITQISHPLPSGLPVTPHCASTLIEVMDALSGGPRALFILELQQNFQDNRLRLALDRATEWDELTDDQREICLLTAAITAWGAKAKAYMEQVSPSGL